MRACTNSSKWSNNKIIPVKLSILFVRFYGIFRYYIFRLGKNGIYFIKVRSIFIIVSSEEIVKQHRKIFFSFSKGLKLLNLDFVQALRLDNINVTYDGDLQFGERFPHYMEKSILVYQIGRAHV